MHYGYSCLAIALIVKILQMNKIYTDQLAKAVSLSEGIRKNADVLKGRNIYLNTAKMDELSRALEEIAQKQDAAEEALKLVRNQAHALLDQLKEICTENKTPIKLNFPTEQWQNFGIADKR